MIQQPSNRPSRAYIVPMVIVALVVLIGAGFRLLGSTTRSEQPVVSDQERSDTSLTRISEGGEVSVKATWQGLAFGATFTIVMDTHAVELDGYDLAQLATLRVDGGAALRPVRWDAPAGGHHREGTLAFPAEQGGKPVVSAETRTIELTIRDVAGVPERLLTWEP